MRARASAGAGLLKRAVACLVSAAMCVAFTPVVAWGAENTVTSTNSGCTWEAGSYKASGTVEIGGDITYNGNVELILDEDCVLTVKGSIKDDFSSSAGYSLTISGSGTLNVDGSIKGGDGASSFPSEGSGGKGGDITINGGKINVSDNITGGSGGYGMSEYPSGSISGGDGGSVYISGGTVVATDINGGAGGGGGSFGKGGDGGSVYISGGTVAATSINGGRGCGGSMYGSTSGMDGNKYISGGAVYYLLTLDGATATGDTATYNSKTYGKAGGTVVLCADSVPTGMTFEGWDVTQGSVTVTNDKFEMPSSAVTVKANWSASNHTVTFDSQGGSDAGNASVAAGATVAKPADPTRAGYTFAGWYTDTDYGTAWDFANNTMPASDMTLYAKWTLDTYTITYELGANAAAAGNPAIYTVESDTITLQPATRSGYTFAGWYEGDSKVVQITTGSVGDKTLIAKWLSQDASVKKVAAKGVEGTIDNVKRTVEVTLPYNVALPAVGADFEIVTVAGATVTTQPGKEGDVWKFTVTAEDGTTTASYVVTVKQQPAPYVPPSNPSYNVPASGEGGVAVKVTVSGSTAVVAEISASALEGAAGSGAATVTIDLSGLLKGVTQAQLSKSTVDKLLDVVNDAGNAVESVTVNLGGAVLTVDAKALAAIAAQAKGTSVTLGVAAGTADSLNSAQKHALSPFEVVQLYFEAQIKSGGVAIHDFNGGSVRVSVALEPRAGHDPSRYVVLYVGEGGTIERYACSWAEGMLSFMAPHFSAYAVVYVEDATQAAIEALEALPQADKLKTSQAKEAVKRAESALGMVAALDDGQRMLVDEALVANAESVVATGNALVVKADKKAAAKVKSKAFSVRYGKSKSIYFTTKVSAAGIKVVYKKVSGSKYITVTKSGKVTAKKGMRAGKKYTAKVKVTCGKAVEYVKVTVKAKR